MAWPTVIPIAPKRPAGSIETSSAIQDARSSMLLPFASGSFLTVIGQNYGVPRAPQLSVTDDALYRAIIPVLAWSAKTIKRTTYALLGTIFGTQAALIAANQRPWRVYEVTANEIVFEIPANLIVTTNANASYLHGWSGYALNASGSASTTFTTPGDVRTAQAPTIAGSAICWLYLSGAWSQNTPTTVTYSATTDLTTFTFGSAIVPSGGCPFFIDVVGDGTTTSFRGDYIAASEFVSPFVQDPADPTTTIRLIGDQTIALVSGFVVSLIYNAAPHAFTLSADPTYDATSNRTLVTLTAAVPALINGVLLHPQEVADGVSPPTAPHNDRVYLSGFGVYDVFKYYYDLLVRAAGIVVRLEIVADYTHTHRSIP